MSGESEALTRESAVADRPDFDELVYAELRRYRYVMRAGELAAKLGTTPQAVTRALRRLARVGRAYREADGWWAR